MSWLLLLAAILLEVSGTVSMKLAEGFSRPLPSLLIFVFYGLSFVALTYVLRSIDVSVAYAVWAGLGTALVTLVGVVWFREPLTLGRVVSIGLIVVGVVGLHLSTRGS
ncbi:MAG: multidrug efflux SMR transporter [Deferrisomatales bacterium]